MRTIKTWWLILAFVSGFGLAMWAEDLALNWRNNYLEFSAPHMHFLTGKPLERLQHGLGMLILVQFVFYPDHVNLSG